MFFELMAVAAITAAYNKYNEIYQAPKLQTKQERLSALINAITNATSIEDIDDPILKYDQYLLTNSATLNSFESIKAAIENNPRIAGSIDLIGPISHIPHVGFATTGIPPEAVCINLMLPLTNLRGTRPTLAYEIYYREPSREAVTKRLSRVRAQMIDETRTPINTQRPTNNSTRPYLFTKIKAPSASLATLATAATQLSAAPKVISAKHNVKNYSEQTTTQKPKFKFQKDSLLRHFDDHKRDFKGKYIDPDSYEKGAIDVISTGERFDSKHEGMPSTVFYKSFRKNLFHFVAVRGSTILTHHIKDQEQIEKLNTKKPIPMLQQFTNHTKQTKNRTAANDASSFQSETTPKRKSRNTQKA